MAPPRIAQEPFFAGAMAIWVLVPSSDFVVAEATARRNRRMARESTFIVVELEM